MTVIAFRTREQISQDARAAELPHRREFTNPTDQRIGGPLGRAVIMGLINDAEFDVAVKWGKLHGEYIDTITDPDSHTDLKCERIAARYNDGVKILDKQPKRVFHAVMALSAYGEDWGDLVFTAAAAKIGLDALAREF